MRDPFQEIRTNERSRARRVCLNCLASQLALSNWHSPNVRRGSRWSSYRDRGAYCRPEGPPRLQIDENAFSPHKLFVALRYESCVSARVVVETPCPAISLNTLVRFHILFIPNILSGGGCLVSTILIELSSATVCARLKGCLIVPRRSAIDETFNDHRLNPQ